MSRSGRTLLVIPNIEATRWRGIHQVGYSLAKAIRASGREVGLLTGFPRHLSSATTTHRTTTSRKGAKAMTPKKIRFTCRFMLQNLADFDPRADAVPYGDMLEVDQYILGRLSWLIGRMTDAFDEWNLHLF